MSDAAAKDIRIVDTALLPGPNLWAYVPVLVATVDIGALEDFPSNAVPGVPQRIESWLPGLVEHRCSPGVRGGFLMRLHEGTWPGHILEHVTIELQSLAGMPTGFGRAREAGPRGVYKVVVEARQEQVTQAALLKARELVLAAYEGRDYDVAEAVAELREIVEDRWLGPSTANIVEAAEDRRIPAIRLNDANLVQFGHGCRQRRIWTAETSATSAIAEGISRDKQLTRRLLCECGVPVPEGREVASPDDAWEAAEDIGTPVVLKPVDGNHGRGVFTNLMTREELEAAYAVAVDEGSGVLVERFVPGLEHRLLVVGGKLVAAARGELAWVTGDGRSTVQELIESQLNTDPRRGRTENHPLNYVRIDSSARMELARQGLTAEGVPADGQRVLIQRNGNVANDCTDLVHPEVAAAATLAARVVGLDIAGIDLVAEDISRPLQEQGGAIVEVNAGPGLLMHIRPAEGTPRPVGKAIVDHLFPEGDNGRIPLVGVSGARGKTAVARLVASLLRLQGHRTGLACSDGTHLDARLLHRGDNATYAAGQRLLLNRSVEAAVIENDVRVILTHGLPYDRCTVGVVTNADTAGLEAFGVESREQLFKALRTQVDVVLAKGAAVLNARDSLLVEMSDLCDGEVVYFSLEADHPVIAAHRAAGGRAVLARDGRIVLASGATDTVLAELAAVPAAGGGLDLHQVDNVLAAVAAGWALGMDPALLRAGIEAFGTDAAPAQA